MKVMIMEHPVNDKVFEVLFSEDGKKFISVDGQITQDTLKRVGYSVKSTYDFEDTCPTPYKLMAKSLAEKIVLLRTHVRYKDELKFLHSFKRIGMMLIIKEQELGEDFDIPEIVVQTANHC